jgi:plastocyanin
VGRRLAVVAGIFGVVAVAAGGSLVARAEEPACVAEGSALTISAKDVKFSKDCLVAPADTAFTITFENQDAKEHNVAVYDEANGNRPVFKGEVFAGPKTVTYNVPPIPQGTYRFVCDPHDDKMRGRFVVGDPPSASEQPTPSTTTTTAGLLPL